MAHKRTYEELEQRLRELEREALERKRVEEALQESKELLDNTFASLADAVFVVDTSTRTIVACNSAVYVRQPFRAAHSKTRVGIIATGLFENGKNRLNPTQFKLLHEIASPPPHSHNPPIDTLNPSHNILRTFLP